MRSGVRITINGPALLFLGIVFVFFGFHLIGGILIGLGITAVCS